MLEIETISNTLFLQQVKYVHGILGSSVYEIYQQLPEKQRRDFDIFLNIYMNKSECPDNDPHLRQACIELAMKYYFL